MITGRARTGQTETGAIAPIKIIRHALGLRGTESRRRGALVYPGAAIGGAGRGRFGWITDAVTAVCAAATRVGLTDVIAPK